MKKKIQEKHEFHSIAEFEKHYLPKAFGKALDERQSDAHTLGVKLAKESFRRIASLKHK